MFRYLLILLVAISVAFSVSCKKDEEDTVTSGDAEASSTFTEANSQVVADSIISMPQSLLPPSSSGKIVDPVKSPSLNGGGMAGIYSGVTQYISFAESMKNMVKELMGHIIKSPLLHTATLGEKLIIPDDASDPNAPKGVMVEKPATGDYKWKVSLYMTAESLTPEMIIRFNMEGAGAKGRLLWKMTEADEEAANKGFAGIVRTSTVDVTFDGTGANKTLEVKFVQDLSSLFAYATANWANLDATERENLDLGQPTKVFLNAVSDGTTYTIYGTSYHEGWAMEQELGGKGGMFGEGRNM